MSENNIEDPSGRYSADAGDAAPPPVSYDTTPLVPPTGPPVEPPIGGPTAQQAGEPVAPPTESGFTLPGTWHTAPAVPAEPAPNWREEYLKEKKKSQIFLVAAIVAGLLFVATAAWSVARSTGGPFMGPAAMRFSGPGGGPGGAPGGGPDGGRGPGGGQGPGAERGARGDGLVREFFKSDGSLNDDAVKAFKEFLAAQGSGENATATSRRLRAGINMAVRRGAITQKQADELASALGLPAVGGSEPSANPTSGA